MRISKVVNPLYVYRNRHLIKPALSSRAMRYSTRWFRPLRRRGVALSNNDRRVLAMKDRHLGERCFIIGSGPSLTVQDLDRLKNENTFSCNKIYLVFDATEWRPTYYSVLDVLVAENCQEQIKNLRLEKIFGECVRAFFSGSSATWIGDLPVPRVDGEYQCKFSENALEGVYGGWTVLYFQIQLAFYMGFREIYLIGLDFSFEIAPSTGKFCGSGEILESRGEVNHFHPDYRKPGESWTMPLLDRQRSAFSEARSAIEKRGGTICNASRQTKLDVFPRVNFDSLVS